MEKAIITIVGIHANETPENIFKRKIEDINKFGQTFWVISSRKAQPLLVQEFCQKGEVDVYFVSASTTAKPTKTGSSNNFFSVDKIKWENIPSEISIVTGKGNALIMDKLEVKENLQIDLNQYAEYQENEPLKIMLGCSTLCCVSQDMSNHPNKVKSNIRKVHAIGRLTNPFCVWVKE